MSALDDKPFPKAPLIGALVLVGASLVMVGAARLGLIETPASAAAAPTTASVAISRDMRFFDLADGGIRVEVIPASNNPTALEAFKREYLQYRADFDYSGNPTGTRVNYHDEWGLTKIEDTKGNTITYNYENYSIQNPEIYRRTTHTEPDIEILTPDGSWKLY